MADKVNERAGDKPKVVGDGNGIMGTAISIFDAMLHGAAVGGLSQTMSKRNGHHEHPSPRPRFDGRKTVTEFSRDDRTIKADSPKPATTDAPATQAQPKAPAATLPADSSPSPDDATPSGKREAMPEQTSFLDSGSFIFAKVASLNSANSSGFETSSTYTFLRAQADSRSYLTKSA